MDDGFTEKLDQSGPMDGGWYLAHHPVILERKNTKCGIVFDSAAEAKGYH